MEVSFHGFVGQRSVVEHLKTQLQGAQALGQPCPHILVLGPSGMGKTKLIRSLAHEAGVDCRVVHGKASQKEVCQELCQLSKGDFLFLDEAHHLPRESQECLYEVIDSSQASSKVSEGFLKTLKVPPAKSKDGKLIIPGCTIALATNEPSGLLEALHRRMEITVHLADYPKLELMDIATQTATRVGLLLGRAALRRIATAALGQPRETVKIIHGMNRLYHADKSRMMTEKDVLKYLKSTGRDRQGLGIEQQKYLKKLHRLGHASLATMSSLLGLETEYAEEKIEAGLVKLGYLYKGSGGRRLTRDGEEWVRRLMERKLGKGNRALEALAKKEETDEKEEKLPPV